MSKTALLILAGGLLLSTAACVQQPDQPLTPWQQQYYKNQQNYQTLGDNRRTDSHSCPPSTCR